MSDPIQALRKLLKIVLKPILLPVARWYLRRERTWKRGGMVLKVPPGVFHPGLYISTGVMLGFLEKMYLVQDSGRDFGHGQEEGEKEGKGKVMGVGAGKGVGVGEEERSGKAAFSGLKVLEVGAGSGAISIRMAQMGAKVTATEISKTAVAAIESNVKLNQVDVHLVQGDLFAGLDDKFDLVVVNPPYYPAAVKNEAEYAWYCGEGFEFFLRFFTELPAYLNKEMNLKPGLENTKIQGFKEEKTFLPGRALMVLSEDCELERIKGLAEKAGLSMREVYRERKWGEWNFIFEISVENKPPKKSD